MWLLRGRKYPIKRDENGLSARQHAFNLFAKGQRPSRISKIIPISLRTACRYYEDFKKLHHRVPYSTIRQWVRESPELSERVIILLATSLDMSRDEVVARMQKPWGLMEAMKGRWPDYGLDRQKTEIENRLIAALEIVNIADKVGHTDPQLVRKTLKQLMTGRGDEVGT